MNLKQRDQIPVRVSGSLSDPKRGRPPAAPPSRADLVKLYVKEARAVRDVAAVQERLKG